MKENFIVQNFGIIQNALCTFLPDLKMYVSTYWHLQKYICELDAHLPLKVKASSPRECELCFPIWTTSYLQAQSKEMWWYNLLHPGYA